jgi:ParB family chromosome partitioning protein
MSAQKSTPKIALTAPQTIPLDKLALHDGNVRQIRAGVSIESLAADIARRGLLQSLSVRPVLDDAGEKTGKYAVQAGGRRLRALQLLVKQKKLAKNAPVPCIVRTEGFVEADSLAENTEREALHPLDQFRAFAALREKGEGEETIAAAFGVSAAVVKQRLKLANASPLLLKAYEDDEISLDQLMAFCLADDHKRQEEVWAALKAHWNKGPAEIRRMLTERTVQADDRRAVFIGAEAYKAAGGIIIRDLFDEDEGGYLQDVPLLERLVGEKLAAEAETIRAEGWAWIEAAVDFPWNHHRDFRVLKPISPALNEQEEEEHEQLTQELDELESVADDDLAPEDGERIAAIKAKLAEFDARSAVYSDEQKAKAGAFVSLNDDGALFVERGYRRLTDIAAEAQDRPASGSACGDDGGSDEGSIAYEPGEPEDAAGPVAQNDDDSAELPDKLLTELTAYHSLGLRNAMASDHRIAQLAVLHVLTLKLFYRYAGDSCLQIEARDSLVPAFAGLGEFKAAKEILARHEAFEKLLPESETEVWDALLELDSDTQDALFAHCAGLTVNALHEGYARSNKRRHALQLAQALELDMGCQGFTTTAANYLGRIKKQQILETVAEVKGEQTAELLADHKKKEMAAEAERLLAGTGWLPEPLRTPVPLEQTSDAALPAFLNDEDGALQAA